jgi:hypothetical protein
MRVRAVDPKERDNEKSRQNGNNYYYRTNAERYESFLQKNQGNTPYPFLIETEHNI